MEIDAKKIELLEQLKKGLYEECHGCKKIKKRTAPSPRGGV